MWRPESGTLTRSHGRRRTAFSRATAKTNLARTTREQLAAIFYRYADYKGYDLTVKGDLDKFKDADKITDYAKTAMQWAVGSGLVKGKSGNLLDPQGTATRAEIAAMLHRFIEKYELVQGKAPGGLMAGSTRSGCKSQRLATVAC